MIDQVLNLMVTAVDAVITWWNVLMTRTGAGSLYLVIMCVILTIGILLSPLLGSLRSGLGGSRGSDYADFAKMRHYEHKTGTYSRSIAYFDD